MVLKSQHMRNGEDNYGESSNLFFEKLYAVRLYSRK